MITLDFIGINIKKNGKEPLDFCQPLDNEESAELVSKADLLDGVTSVEELLARLPAAFQDPWGEDDDGEEPRDMIGDFDYERDFPKFCRQVEKLQTIDKVLLYSTGNRNDGMRVSFAYYDITGGKFLVGQEFIAVTGNNEWHQEFLSRMEEKNDGEMHVYNVRFDPVKKNRAKKKTHSPLIIEKGVVVGIQESGCPKKIVVPEGVTEIGAFAFADLNSIEQIELPSSIRIIGESAFSGCENLKEAVMPEGLLEIQFAAFQFTGLTKLSLPDSLTHIADLAFSGCDYITWLRLSRAIKDYRRCSWYLEGDEEEPLTIVLPKGCTCDDFIVDEDEDFWNQDGLIVKVEEG